MSWHSLEKIVTLGTERTGIPPDLQALADQYFPGNQLSETDRLLAVLSLLSLHQKGTGKIGRLDNFSSQPVAGQEEAMLSRKSIRHLDLILNGTYIQALPEFAALVVKHELCLPPEGLPQLLDRCLEEGHLFSILAPALGERGRWLMQFNKSWRSLDPGLEPGDWFSKDQAERLRWLRNLRRSDPAKARAVLESGWGAEKSAHKPTLLEELRCNLSQEDEAFLEQCLLDGRKEVRRKSASLLTSLEGSRALTTLFEFAAQHITITGKGIAELQLPDELPAEISKLATTTTKGKKGHNKFGLKASLLYRVLVRIPPNYWERHFAMDPTQLLKAFSAGVWKELLLPAITEAVARHPDIRWMDSLSRYWVRTTDTYLWNNATAKQLMATWPSEVFNQRCIASLQHHGHRLDERSLVTWLLKNSEHPWQDKLTLLVIENFQNWLSSSHTVAWGGRYFRDILNAAAFRGNPQLLGTIRRGWRADISRWEFWEKEIEWFFRTLFFRQEMRSAFTKK